MKSKVVKKKGGLHYEGKEYFSAGIKTEKHKKSSCALSGADNHSHGRIYLLSDRRYLYYQWLSVERNFSSKEVYRTWKLDEIVERYELLDCI